MIGLESILSGGMPEKYRASGQEAILRSANGNANYSPLVSKDTSGKLDDFLDASPITVTYSPKTYSSAAYLVKVKPSQPYKGYPNVSRFVDMVAVNFSFKDLGRGIYGQCFNGSKVIEINESLRENVHEFWKTLRHEARHAIHGLSDRTAVFDYVMRALDEAGEFSQGIYDKVQKYWQKK